MGAQLTVSLAGVWRAGAPQDKSEVSGGQDNAPNGGVGAGISRIIGWGGGSPPRGPLRQCMIQIYRTFCINEVSGTGPTRKHRPEKGRERIKTTRMPEKGCPRKGENGPDKER